MPIENKNQPNWIPVLRTGKFTGRDSATGNASVLDMDRARLDRIVANYNVELAETPLVIGHPQTDHPAFGWVEKFKRMGDVLMALPKQIVPEFAQAVRDGAYKYVSCKVRPNDTIAHIGFLGAVPPAVNGLGAVTLAQKDAGVTIELSGADLWLEKSLFRRIVGIFQRLRDNKIEVGGLEAADKIVTADDIAGLQQDIENLEVEDNIVSPSTTLSEPGAAQGGSMDPKVLQAALDAANAKITELSEKLTGEQGKVATLTTELSTLKNSITKEKDDARAVEFSEFCDGLINQGKMKKEEKPEVVANMEAAFVSGDIELSEGEGKAPVKKSALEYLKNLLSARKPGVEFKEIATPDRIGHATELAEADGLSKEIMAYQKDQEAKGNSISVVEALAAVKKGR